MNSISRCRGLYFRTRPKCLRTNNSAAKNRKGVCKTDVYNLALIFKQLSISLEQYQKNNMQSLDLSPAQALVLACLLTRRERLPAAANLQEELGISRATISLHLKKLRQLGYIQTEVVSEDNRKKKIILMQKAYNIESELKSLQTRQEKCLGRGIPEKYMDKLEGNLQTILTNIRDEMHNDMHK